MAHNHSGCQLLIKLQAIEYRTPHSAGQRPVYFSFSTGDRMHFSSCIDPSQTVLADDLLIPVLTEELPDCLYLQRWENHMIMFDHEVSISELRSRSATKKCYETKAGEMLSFMVLLLQPHEIRFGDKYVQSISQHYLIVDSLILKQTKSQQRADPGPSFYTIQTSSSEYVMPVLDGLICIKLPETFVFKHFRNGSQEAQSRMFNSN